MIKDRGCICELSSDISELYAMQRKSPILGRKIDRAFYGLKTVFVTVVRDCTLKGGLIC